MIRTVGLTIALLLSVVVSVVVPAGCKKQDSAPRPLAPLPDDKPGAGSASAAEPTPPSSTLTDAELGTLMEEIVAYMRSLGGAAAAAKGDCAAMAAGIERVAGENRDLIERTMKVDSDPTAEDRAEAWLQARQAEIEPVFAALFTELKKCENDPAVQAAVEKMGTM